MSVKKIIITASSAQYFSLMAGLLFSIKDRPEAKDVVFGLYDLGLTQEQKQWLAKYQVHIVKPDWQFGLDDNCGLSIAYKGLLARPFISRYFPGFDQYLYIDADAWIQDWSAVEDYFNGINHSVIAITPELNPAYSNHFADAKQYRDFVYETYEACRDVETAERYGDYSILNAGVFAIPVDSPVWTLWEEELGISIQQTTHHCVEQTSLNLALLKNFDIMDHHSIHLLSAPHNWLCHLSLPFFNDSTQQFVEPFSPYHEVGILHRSSDAFKTQKTVEINKVSSGQIDLNVLYKEGDYLKNVPSELIIKIDSDWQKRAMKKF